MEKAKSERTNKFLNSINAYIKQNTKKTIVIASVIMLVITVLILVICISSGEKGRKFKTQDEMYNYLNGVWFADSYPYNFFYIDAFVFLDGKTYRLNFEEMLNNNFKEIIVNQGVEKFETIDYSTFLKENIDISDINNTNFKTIKHKKGIAFVEDTGDSGSKLIINKSKSSEGNQIITLFNEDSSIKEEYVKISDTFNLEGVADRYFELVKEEFELPAKDFIPSPKEYIKKFLKSGSKAYRVSLAYDDGKSLMYTDTGSRENFNEVAQYAANTNNTQIILDNGKLYLTYDGNELRIVERGNYYLSYVLEYVELLIEDYPYALSVDEINNIFKEEATVSNNIKALNTEIDGIKYKIQVSDSGSTKIITINF